jgi:hypothetical protein
VEEVDGEHAADWLLAASDVAEQVADRRSRHRALASWLNWLLYWRAPLRRLRW